MKTKGFVECTVGMILLPLLCLLFDGILLCAAVYPVSVHLFGKCFSVVRGDKTMCRALQPLQNRKEAGAEMNGITKSTVLFLQPHLLGKITSIWRNFRLGERKQLLCAQIRLDSIRTHAVQIRKVYSDRQCGFLFTG